MLKKKMTKISLLAPLLTTVFYFAIINNNLADPPKKIRTISETKKILTSDIKSTYNALDELLPPVVFFGGSRLPPTSLGYKYAQKFSYYLYQEHLVPRVGGYENSGVMTAIIDSYIEGYQRNLSNQFYPLHRFQVVNLERWKPTEESGGLQKTKEEAIYHFVHLLTARKWGMMQKALAYIALPGGPGTVNEFFEVWKQRIQEKTRAPIILQTEVFWKEKFETIEDIKESFPDLITEKELEMVRVEKSELFEAKNKVGQLKRWIIANKNLNPTFSEKEEELIPLLKKELKSLKNDLYAISLVASPDLTRNAPEYKTLKEFIDQLEFDPNIVLPPFRISGISDSTLRSNSIFHEEMLKNKNMTQRDFVPKTSIMESEFYIFNSYAYISLPVGVKGLSQLFSLLDQMHLSETHLRPVVLIGKNYWHPIFNKIIAPLFRDDVKNLILITDQGDEIFKFLDQHHVYSNLLSKNLERRPWFIKIVPNFILKKVMNYHYFKKQMEEMASQKNIKSL